jgi:hypothetical protein
MRAMHVPHACARDAAPAVQLKVDLAETHGELMSCKRALTRAMEREAKLSERVSMLEAPWAPQGGPGGGGGGGRRASLFTPRAADDELEPPVDTQAHDELSAPEILVGGGTSGEEGSSIPQ